MMVRRSSVTAAMLLLFVGVLGAQSPRRADGGVWGDPHKSPLSLTAADVDTKMWPIVQSINQSGWVWTTESCQGHDDKTHGSSPLLGLVTNDIGRALGLLAEAIVEENVANHVRDTWDPHGIRFDAAMFTGTWKPTLGRYQVRIIVPADSQERRDRALSMFTRFAASVR